jgi:hypothetical protein
VKLTVRPISAAARARMTGNGTESSMFRSTWTSTQDLLEREVRMLRGRGVILMIDVAEADIRLDGKLRADAKPFTSAVAVAFESPTKGPLLFCCGRYRKWQDNVRAIALGLEALRAVDRHGIVRSTEQYEGFRQIAGGSSVEDWVSTLSAYSGWSHADVRADREGAYKAAVKMAHPDNGGSSQAFARVQAARR